MANQFPFNDQLNESKPLFLLIFFTDNLNLLHEVTNALGSRIRRSKRSK